MVGPGITGIDVFIGKTLQVVGDDEAIEGNGVGHTGHIFHIGIPGTVPEIRFFFFG